ncbi:MAG TPA: fucose-binding lectin II [Blastocatellia bacterium]|nr:fucose-binding lectin II [Blastocatellia bacterium]
MANCTTFGFPGTNVPLSDLLTTSANLTCFLSGYTQSANSQTVSIFQTGSPTALATITGGGGAGAKAMSTAAFQIQPGKTYYATVKSSGSQVPRVLAAYDALSYGTTTYVGGYTLCADDTPSGGDCDFNDCVVNLNWTLFAG